MCNISTHKAEPFEIWLMLLRIQSSWGQIVENLQKKAHMGIVKLERRKQIGAYAVIFTATVYVKALVRSSVCPSFTSR